jgi:cation diffusion facilitator family transporter
VKEKVAIISVLVNALLAGGKIAVGAVSGSIAIMAEGYHSLMDVFSSGISYLGIKYAKKPSDEDHPYGHYKFEVLSGMAITLILFITGSGIIFEAFQKIFKPEKIEIGYLAFSVMAFSAIANEIMARVKINYGKKENSISLLSDGTHSRVDAYSSLAILVGLFLAKYFAYADSILAIAVGLYIIKESFSLGKEAADSLLDVSAGEEIEEKIRLIAQKENIEIDSLKTQKKGSAITANLEIKLPSSLKVEEATKISNSLREKLIGAVESLQYVAIQIKSLDLSTSFFQPAYGRGFGWQRKGKFREKIEKAAGRGPDGDCVCPKCGYKIPHQRGIPCSSIKCPKCDINLERK